MRCGLKTEEILTYIVNVIKAERRQHRATAAGHVIQTATRRTAASSDAMPVSCVRLSLSSAQCRHTTNDETSKQGSPYSITERRVLELIPVLRSQPAGDVSHKPGGGLPLLFARPAVTPATLKRAATNFAAW